MLVLTRFYCILTSDNVLLQESTVQLQRRNHFLPPELKRLADDISQNRFLNMRQFDISKETHQNTVFIGGLLCHVAVLLQHAQDNKFLKPLTLIHYDPSALKGKYLPAVPYDMPSVLSQPPMGYSNTVRLTGVNVNMGIVARIS